MTYIVLLSASVSEPSINTETLKELAVLAEQVEGVEAGFVKSRIIEIPHYAAHIEATGENAVVAAFREEIQRADAVVVATPQYNGRYPAVLQNALDWSTRGEFRRLWAGKPVGVISVSPGARKAALANEQLRGQLGGSFKAQIVEPHIEVGGYEELKAAGGVFAEGELRSAGIAMIEALRDAATANPA